MDDFSFVLGSSAFIGDCVPVKGDIPIYINQKAALDFLEKLCVMQGVRSFYSAWDKAYTKEELADMVNFSIA